MDIQLASPLVKLQIDDMSRRQSFITLSFFVTVIVLVYFLVAVLCILSFSLHSLHWFPSNKLLMKF